MALSITSRMGVFLYGLLAGFFCFFFFASSLGPDTPPREEVYERFAILPAYWYWLAIVRL
jgi:hypothetical protein